MQGYVMGLCHPLTPPHGLTMVGIVQFPEEKVRYEAATMRYIAAHTTIPVPRVYHYGTAAENPTGLGPFIIMDHIDHEQTLSHALNDPSREIGERHGLDPDISDEKLEFLYRQMATIVLQLSTLTFPGSGPWPRTTREPSRSRAGR